MGKKEKQAEVLNTYRAFYLFIYFSQSLWKNMNTNKLFLRININVAINNTMQNWCNNI